MRDEERSLNSKSGWKPWKPPPRRRKAWPRWTGFRGMTLRDWLPIVGALLIPVVVAAGTWAITWQQGRIEDQRAKAERELAKQRAQDEALQAYLDQMNTLLLERGLRSSEESSKVRTLARAQTLTVLARLDPSRKAEVMRFLVESDLVNSEKDSESPVIKLNGADLQGVNLGADMLTDQPFSQELIGYDLHGVDLGEADLRDANLSLVSLAWADLARADLSGANLQGASLHEAFLSGTNLTNANLEIALGLTSEQIAEQTGYLEGATMPNGQKYEDWLKSKENGKNSGS